MKTRILIGTGVLAAFLGGTLFGGVARESLSNAFAQDEEQPVVVERRAPAPRRAVYAEPRPVYREVEPAPRVRRRSTEDQILIVAGSSGAGAAIGALASRVAPPRKTSPLPSSLRASTTLQFPSKARGTTWRATRCATMA